MADDRQLSHCIHPKYSSFNVRSIKKIRNFVVRIHPICHTQALLTCGEHCGEHLAKHSNNSEFLMHTEYFKLYSIDPSAVRYQDTFVQNSQKKILES